MVGTRLLLYSHDTYGLGHLRRSLRLAWRLVAERDVAAVLLVTGSPCARRFPLPPRCDLVSIPLVTKGPTGEYQPSALPIPLEELVRLRGEIVRAAVSGFQPDVILVDHAPLGMGGELRPLLAELADRTDRPRLVLGMRDIVDVPDRVRDEWDATDVWDVLEHVYDRVLVYGDPAVLTTAQELDLPARLPDRVRFVGYLADPVSPLAGAEATRGAPGDLPRIVVTVGGGGDGAAVLSAYAEALTTWRDAPFRSEVIAGPFLKQLGRLRLALRASGATVEVHDFVEEPRNLLAGASGVVSMAGYNTAVEVLSARAPALFIPRGQPRREQAIRAERLSRVAAISHCTIGNGAPQRISRFIHDAIRDAHPAAAPRVRLNGLSRAVAELRELWSVSTPGGAHVCVPSA